MNREEKLKSCPFCGGEAEIRKSHDMYYPTCKNEDDCCGKAMTDGEFGYADPEFDTKNEAIISWNTRVDSDIFKVNPEIIKEIKLLKSYFEDRWEVSLHKNDIKWSVFDDLLKLNPEIGEKDDNF